MRTFLVLRFSAMGDVLLSLPVLNAAIEQNSNVKFVVLTRPKFAPFFDAYENVKVFSADVSKDYKGILGLWKLAKVLNDNYDFEAILDLHQQLRTFILKYFLKCKKIYTIDKGRQEKAALTKRNNKTRRKLNPSFERYAMVFRLAGLTVDLDKNVRLNYFNILSPSPIVKYEKWVGIAPFAKHKGKIWPFGKIEKVVELLAIREPKTKVLLFGGGDNELMKINALCERFSNTLSVAGKYSLKEELAIITQLDVMLCMDSSNMHMAKLAGIKTVSIWGATHSDAGFNPYGSNKDGGIIEISTNELPCRPCSVYGKTPCYRKDYACLERISVETVLNKL